VAVTLTEQGLAIDGKHIPVYSGTVHYWRLDRDLWPSILDRVQELGFGMIETYVPWSIHETAPERFDWGEHDPLKDFEAFCQLCEERGMYMQVRPGPLINAELTDFGFPEWVLLDPAVQARTAVGSLHLDEASGLHPPLQFPVPSYASPAFMAAVGRWLDVVCPIIVRHLAPTGCIIAVQSDNESCYLFHDEAYATDYSPASIAAYRQFLQARYASLDDLNALYHRQYPTFAAIEPPRDCQIQSRADVPWHRDWVEYKEYYLHHLVAEISQMMKARGVRDVPIFHDVAWQFRTPLDIAKMEADPDIDWVGINLYRNRKGYNGIAQQMRYQSGTTRLPFVPELGAGIWCHHPETPTPAEGEFLTLAALMHGMRAMNFYMIVERERWQGSPITRFGEYREDYSDFFRRLTAFLQTYPLGAFSRQPQALLLMNYDLGRYAAMSSTLHYAHVDLLGLPYNLGRLDLPLGFRWDVTSESDHHLPDNWQGTVTAHLKRQQLDYDISDTHIDPQRLQRYPIVCLPTADFMDAADQQKLLDYVAQGGCLLIGPGVPYLDSHLRPCTILSDVAQQPGENAWGTGKLIWVATDALAEVFPSVMPSPHLRWDAPAVDVVEHVHHDRRLVYVANPQMQPQDVTITSQVAYHYQPAWASGAAPQHGNQLTLTLAPNSIQIWEATHD
jgi:beta-galactosidase